MSLYKQFETNKEAELDGIWVEIGDGEEAPAAFKIARMSKSNKRYTKAIEKATRPHKKAIELDILNENLAEKLMKDVFVSTVLLNWRNVKNREGNVMEFNKENALQLFKDLPDLYNLLEEQAKTASLFREAELEGNSKN